MAIEFTDDQLKQMTLDTLNLPKMIDNPEDGTGLIQQKENVYVTKDALDVTDKQHKIFTDHWTQVAHSYHTELALLNRELRTDYNESDLILGGQSLPPHYTQTWPNLVPIVIPSNNGLPVNQAPNESEIDLIIKIDDAINKLVNGWGDNSFNDTLSADYVAGSGSMSFTNSNPNADDELILISGSDSMLAKVGSSGGGYCDGGTGTNETDCVNSGGTWVETISITPLSPDKSFPTGTSASNSFAGFTNSERGHLSTSSAYDVQVYLEQLLEEKVIAWKDSLIAQKNSILGNDETNQTRKALNQQALSSLDTIVSDIDEWLSMVVQDANGKFTDTGLQKIIPNKDLRKNTEINQRVDDIVNNLGNVAQAPDGSVTGTGVYFDLFDFIKLRIAKSGGTLYSWYGMDLAVKHFDTKIAGANKQLSEYENLFTISLLVEEAQVGDSILIVDDASIYLDDDEVKVFDNESQVLDTKITNINGNNITLENELTEAISTSKKARIVKVNN